MEEVMGLFAFPEYDDPTALCHSRPGRRRMPLGSLTQHGCERRARARERERARCVSGARGRKTPAAAARARGSQAARAQARVTQRASAARGGRSRSRRGGRARDTRARHMPLRICERVCHHGDTAGLQLNLHDRVAHVHTFRVSRVRARGPQTSRGARRRLSRRARADYNMFENTDMDESDNTRGAHAGHAERAARQGRKSP